jgi:hypothetical protein
LPRFGRHASVTSGPRSSGTLRRSADLVPFDALAEQSHRREGGRDVSYGAVFWY